MRTKYICLITLTIFIMCCSTSEEFVRSGVDFNKYERIAVLPLTDYPNKYGSGIQVADILSMKLLNSSLTILDRSQTATLLSEQKMSMAGITSGNNLIEVGNLLGVQAILTGSINEYGYTTVDIQVVQGGAPAPMDISAASITIKLIDCETGQVIWAGSARGTQVGPNQEASAASMAVDSILKKFTTHF